MTPSSNPEPARRLLRSARREAGWTLLIWAAALVWVVGSCWLFGYRDSPQREDEFRQIAGLPAWVFYGIMLPWVVCTVLTVVIAQCGITDEDLGVEAGESAPVPDPADSSSPEDGHGP